MTTTTATTLHWFTLHYSYSSTTLQVQLQLPYTTLHPVVVGEVTTATIALTPKKRNSNHLSVHQWIRSAIHASQQLTSPIVSYPWNFRHRLVRHYWYPLQLSYIYSYLDNLSQESRAGRSMRWSSTPGLWSIWSSRPFWLMRWSSAWRRTPCRGSC